jgi:hypothetical protein
VPSANHVKIMLLSLGMMSGCVDRTPPPPDADIPRGRGGPYREHEPVKPLPGQGGPQEAGGLPPPPYYDAPLVSQETPEQRAFVDAYNAVGRPRIVVFVNRTLEGDLIPVNADDEAVGRRDGYERTVESRDRYNDREPAERYLRPGEYDEIATKQIDYEAIETILTDWLAAGGRTEIVSPITVRQRLTDEQVKDLQSGRPRMMGEIARELDADVLVHVAARPTRQTRQGLEIRLVAEAINVGRGGQSIGRGVVDVPPPLDKPKINKFTRFLARSLMDRMIGTWENMPPPTAGDRTPRDAAPSDTRPQPGSPLLEPPDAPAPALPPSEAPGSPAKEQ